MNGPGPIKIAITALGAQGMSVLADWIGKLGEENGFLTQMTSVPGVSQHTGATVYYVELFPRNVAQAAGKDPVLALMAVPGDVDIVIAAEMMEAGRAIMRGFVTSQTTLITSSHRDYAIVEKSSMADGRQDPETILDAARKCAKTLIAADFEAAAAETGATLSAVLFGALAGSGALPIERAAFEDRIGQSDHAAHNLQGFACGFEMARSNSPTQEKRDPTQVPSRAMSSRARPVIERMRSSFPSVTHYYIGEGLKRVVDFQDLRYADDYLNWLETVLAWDREAGGERRDWQLTEAAAKHLALWMTYEDSIRVADLKTRAQRFDRFREDVRAEEVQIVKVYDFLHPRVEEFCDILPAGLAGVVLNSPFLRKITSLFLGNGRRIPTTKIRGFLLLYLISSLRFLRRSSYRYKLERQRIRVWLDAIKAAAAQDYELAVAIAHLQDLIKGYGDTHERGISSYNQIMALIDVINERPHPAAEMRKLMDAALKDEDGIALHAAIVKLGKDAQAAA